MDDDVVPPQRPISPPWHTTFAARGVHPPSFSAFRPHDLRLPANPHGPIVVEHVAWNCDGRRLAAVGVGARVWQPDRGFDVRGSMTYPHDSGADPNHVSWNPTHPDLFCTSSRKGRRIVFWDARRDKPTQTITFDKLRPSSTVYSPDGKTIAFFAMNSPKMSFIYSTSSLEDPMKATWQYTSSSAGKEITASAALFNHAGTAVAATAEKDPRVRFYDYPSLEQRWEKAPLISNSGGVNALALDPYGRYMVTGGADSMINIFGVEDWMRVNTASCEHQITGLSFSHDGEYIAASTLGDYIEIFGTETAEPLHRLKTLGSSPTVSWHPSKHIIAYCGKSSPKEAGPSSFPFVSLFGPGMA